MAAKAVFIDRDGVVNEEREYLHRIEEFRFIERVFDACRMFQRHGYRIVIVTNQSGIGRGYYTEQEYTRLTRWMVGQFAQQGITITDVLHCPHHPDKGRAGYRVACGCRKPAPGMLLEAARRHHLDLSRSLMIGDKEADVAAGRAAGVWRTILVRSGHPIDESATRADQVIDSLGALEALQRIITQQEAE